MAGRVVEYDPPGRFVAGTVGEPGSRTFFLQARGNRTGALTSVVLEKQQLRALAERIDELLDEVMRRTDGRGAPAVAPARYEDLAPLETPIEEDFRVGTMSLFWHDDRERVVVECFELLEETESEEEESADETPSGEDHPGSVLRVWLSAGLARAFAKRGLALVEAGRPPCPFCAEPLDPSGHICPRANGYRR